MYFPAETTNFGRKRALLRRGIEYVEKDIKNYL